MMDYQAQYERVNKLYHAVLVMLAGITDKVTELAGKLAMSEVALKDTVRTLEEERATTQRLGYDNEDLQDDNADLQQALDRVQKANKDLGARNDRLDTLCNERLRHLHSTQDNLEGLQKDFRAVCDNNEALLADNEQMAQQVRDANDTVLRLQDRLNALYGVAAEHYGTFKMSTLTHDNPLIDYHECNGRELVLIHAGKTVDARNVWLERNPGRSEISARQAINKARAVHGL